MKKKINLKSIKLSTNQQANPHKFREVLANLLLLVVRKVAE